MDTVKSIEKGRRFMSLYTYLRIVEALETTPASLMYMEKSDEYVERMLFIMMKSDTRQRQFTLYMVEQLIKEHERYLNDDG